MTHPTSITGIHHLKLPVGDIETTKAFYCDVLGFDHIAQFDHIDRDDNLFAIILEKKLPSGSPLLVELRLNLDQAKKQHHWDPIVWSVPLKKDLDGWKEWFEGHGVQCSRVLIGVKGWVLSALDPDQKFVRIYCDESHEWTKDTDQDDFWHGNWEVQIKSLYQDF
ncbi:hypothetical protein HII31_02376 [Pseudocercospora fuligena]|uniref:VOC domain-containing protein n=1 Tax=Pseudocercospora fuligena TaxID=685502 RepID=A0A8H6RSB6_9PEZI|nr:hypothetical protein HII31_02376 [Pseudocercospora fuligena]